MSLTPGGTVSTLLLIIVDLCCRASASTTITCSIASAYSRLQAPQREHIDHHISKGETLDNPPRGGKVLYRFSAFCPRYFVLQGEALSDCVEIWRVPGGNPGLFWPVFLVFLAEALAE